MQLRELGLDPWFAGLAADRRDATLALARVVAVDRNRYVIRNERGEVPAELTGRLVHATVTAGDLPCVGDWVCARYRNAATVASIHDVLPRRSFIRRKVPGPDVDYQVLAANVDAAFVVQACQFDFNVRRLERYLVMVRDGHVAPIVLLTKTDLVDAAELEQMITRIRLTGLAATIVCVSNVTGMGIDEVRNLMTAGRTYCLLGSSGVGKTTLTNRLIGDARLETRDVSHTGEGRHATTRRQLIVLANGSLLIDMPGMRELGMLGVDAGIDETFTAIGELAKSCRFTDCSHVSEPGCAVRAAVERRELSEEHLRNFLKLRKESLFHELSYVERRKQDKSFGRMVNSVLKQKDRSRRT